ncbi:MAG: Lrp/AsnC family transcriptional regulator [Lachnospiraceae bacterium]|nr:Lrp/AsnC family transcriptional regulator [Lachnospiraceae bacterium]
MELTMELNNAPAVAVAETTAIDALDKTLLNMMQKNFPLTKTPFKDIAEDLGFTEEEVLGRVQKLKDAGYIRRIGAVLDTKTLSYISCLCAVSVPGEFIQTVAEEINRCENVTHNYQRNNELNLWFTITTKTQKEMDKILKRWEKKMGITIYRFPGLKTYKRKVRFLMKEQEGQS